MDKLLWMREEDWTLSQKVFDREARDACCALLSRIREHLGAPVPARWNLPNIDGAVNAELIRDDNSRFMRGLKPDMDIPVILRALAEFEYLLVRLADGNDNEFIEQFAVWLQAVKVSHSHNGIAKEK